MSASGFGPGGTGTSGSPTGDRRQVDPLDPGTSGPERTVSYQPEERYWTDYLRIALPVLGLLLLIGLVWFWAGQLIGDGDGDPASVAQDPTSVAAPLALSGSPTPEQTVTAESIDVSNGTAPLPPAGTRTSGSGQGTVPTPTPIPAETATSPPDTVSDTNPPGGAAASVDPAVGDTVETDLVETVNLRTAPTRNGSVIRELAPGTELLILGDAVADELGEDRTWWPVRVTSTNEEGFVGSDTLSE